MPPVNAWELYRFVASDYDIFATINPTYDLGRLGCSFGYVGLVMAVAGLTYGVRQPMRN